MVTLFSLLFFLIFPGLHLLHGWDDRVKAQKLEKITDAKARNMVSRLLSRDPQQRMTMAAALVHPFVSGRAGPGPHPLGGRCAQV